MYGEVYWKQEETNDNNYQDRWKEQRDIPKLTETKKIYWKHIITYDLTKKKSEQ